MISKIQLISCPCLPFESLKEFRDYFYESLKNKRGGFSLAVNAEKIIRIDEDQEFYALAQQATYPIIDGVGAQLVSFFKHSNTLTKINLPIESLIAANKFSLKLFLLGATEPVNEKSAAEIQHKYPAINLIGRRNGYDLDIKRLISDLKQYKPDMVLVAMGSPRQEKLALKLSIVFPEICFIGCGGALDVLAGEVTRAPLIIQKSGFEWLYRLIQNPSRIKRQIKLPKIFWLLLTK